MDDGRDMVEGRREIKFRKEGIEKWVRNMRSRAITGAGQRERRAVVHQKECKKLSNLSIAY